MNLSMGNEKRGYVTTMVVLTETGIRNVGMYRMQVYDDKTVGMHWQLHKGGAEHEREARESGQEHIPVAVSLGGDPAVVWSGSAPLPPGVDEFLLAGWLRGKPVELVNVRLRARGLTPKPRLNPIKAGRAAPPSEACVAKVETVFQGRTMKVPVYERKLLMANNRVSGPAIVVEYSATVVIPPFAKGEIDSLGNILMEING
jgi:hypothetical protein